MANTWEQIKRLFQSAAESSPSQPVLHALIERSEAEQQDYSFWKDTLVCHRLMDWVNGQYAIYSVDKAALDESIDFLDTPSSNGFAVHFHNTQYSKRDTIFFLDFLKDQVQEHLNYRKQISDTRTYNRSQWVESTQRHYLKPRIDVSISPFNQQYGNILIELIFRNNKPYRLKFQATNYNDMQFTKAEDFSSLMQQIFL